MKEKEFVERGLFINKEGTLFDEDLNIYVGEDSDTTLESNKIEEIYNNQKEEIKDFMESEE